jgi:outer membrane protein OmpA-like peptidoglycan-associated protein
MRRFLAIGLLLWAFAAPAAAQEGRTLDLAGKTVDLKFTTTDLRFTTVDLRSAAADLKSAAANLKPNAIDVGGKVQDLQVRETATEIRIELAADVLFDFDKATIRPEAATALHNVAEIIRDKGKGRGVRIDGHTDGKGSDAYNQKLSERRAASVKQWLADREGLGQLKMTTQGFGARQPVAPNVRPDGSDDPVGRQKNRRVEIVLAK